jgi:hypothetical protein
MVEGYKEYKHINKRNNKEYSYVIPQIKCECGQVIGKYKLKIHQSRWIHFYFMGNLEEYYLLNNKV